MRRVICPEGERREQEIAHYYLWKMREGLQVKEGLRGV